MVSLIKYIYKFLYHSSLNKYNFISFFPLLSISAGTIIIFFTISVMEGMEEALFQKMESFNFTYTGNLNDTFLESLEAEKIIISNFDIYNGNSRKYLISKNQDYRIATITSLNNFNKFKNIHIKDYLLEYSNEEGIFIGEGLAAEFGLKVGDNVSLASPLDISIITGDVPIDPFVNISGIFSYKFLDYDHNYAFISSEQSLNIFQSSKNDKVFLKTNKKSILSDELITKYNLISFKDVNSEFLKAMNTEKFLYSLFGYMVIFIASMSSISLMSLFIVRKRKQIGILKTLGANNHLTVNIFLLNSLITSFFGVLLGCFIYALIILFNEKFHFIQNIFFNSTPFDFSIHFNFVYFIQALLISSVFMVFGSIYPILKISKINLATILRERI